MHGFVASVFSSSPSFAGQGSTMLNGQWLPVWICCGKLWCVHWIRTNVYIESSDNLLERTLKTGRAERRQPTDVRAVSAHGSEHHLLTITFYIYALIPHDLSTMAMAVCIFQYQFVEPNAALRVDSQHQNEWSRNRFLPLRNIIVR